MMSLVPKTGFVQFKPQNLHLVWPAPGGPVDWSIVGEPTEAQLAQLEAEAPEDFTRVRVVPRQPREMRASLRVLSRMHVRKPPQPSAAAEAPRPQPLADEIKLPPFPVEALPGVLRTWVEAQATALQVPVDMPAAVALGAVAAACAGRFSAQPRPGWTEPLNLYIIAAAASADRKSALISAAVKPLQAYEKALGLAYHEAIHDLKRAHKDASEFEGAEAEAEAETIETQLEALQREGRPRTLGDDVTPEALAGVMHRNDGRLAIMSPEGVGFIEGLSRYGKGSNIELVLKAHPGDQISIDRKANNESMTIEAPLLTLVLACQPEAIAELLINNTSYHRRGLPQRFLYFMPKSRVGGRQIAAQPVPAGVAGAYGDMLQKLLALPAPTHRGLSMREAAAVSLEPPALHFTPEAQRMLVDFETELEPRLVPFGDSVDSWGGKLCGAIVRLAGLLCLVRRVATDSEHCEDSESITPCDVSAAIAIGRYLIPHAKHAFGFTDVDPTVAKAQRILKWIRSNRVNIVGSFSKRDCHQALKGDKQFERADSVDAPLELLVSKGWLELVCEPHEGAGRKPSPRYAPHKVLCPQNPQDPQN